MIYKKLEKPVTMKVYTKTPSKWTLIDNETGQMYQGSEELANKDGHNGWKLLEIKEEGNEVLRNATR
jgi:hypothetical protein